MRREHFHVIAAAVLLLLVTLGCGAFKRKSLAMMDASATDASAEAATADTPEAKKARVAKKIAQLDGIATAKLAPITTKTTLKATPPKPTLEGFQVFPPNTAITSPAQLPALRLDTQQAAYESDALHWCAALIRGTKPTIDDSHLSMCDGYRYVALLRFSSRVNPKLVGPTKFKAGTCQGDVTIFDLENGQNLGAVPFSSTNTDTMEGMQGLELLRITADLEKQCAWSAQLAINAAFGEPPATP